MAESVLKALEPFGAILKPNEPLAAYTYHKLGGPAEVLARPRSVEELAGLVQVCSQKQIPLRILGGGCNVLVRDEGVRGVVLRLSEPAFTQIAVDGRRLQAGSGALLAAAIAEAARHGLAGLETLVGIPGTVGGALRHLGGDRVTDVTQYVRQIELVDTDGHLQSRRREELDLDEEVATLVEMVIVAVELDLEPDSAESIVKRVRKAWIQRKTTQPLSFQASLRAFRNPRGLNAAALIEQAGLAGTRVGGAQTSDRDPNWIIVHPGASARDVLRLLDLIRSQVQERFHVELEKDISVW
jgi:UDP-N-acetylmuramate dehydrogenase